MLEQNWREGEQDASRDGFIGHITFLGRPLNLERAIRYNAVVLREGLREYYDARTGSGMGARDFGWSSLVWEMVDPASGAEALPYPGKTQGASDERAADDDRGP